ncbi:MULTISPECIES: ketoacyl-ACP synthase III family protein [Frankia]|jgi:3-oxoacyl-[acyl-carrier-protein] synthase-3|uniref:3-oxoacyl-[acyl-carrier-protein] synthase n=1 Tax=Frankia alni (strain DSM 45986 / CECT 9034 / ACN14a) TaxID=326424 RepID=Q0RGU5_FRAAA|nr:MULTISPECIES: ketoacyl-ACP synthase III family protein [Frankia]CAJ63291.1 Putative 3-oxoacyl-[acyl-carrier-protein] synthase [Frankia alni ACN14a]
MRTEGLYLAGIGSIVPERVSTDHAVAQGWYEEATRRRSGIVSVAVGGSVPAPDMAVAAARTAVRRSGLDEDDFGILLHSYTHHQGPEGWSPSHYILRKTLDRPVPAVEIRQACLGMLAAIEAGANRLVANSSHPAALVTAADNFSTPLVDRWRSSSAFVLADSASSVVLSRIDGFARLLAIRSMSESRMEALDRGDEPLFPPGITTGRPLDFESRRDFMRQQWAQGIAPPIGHFGDAVAAVTELTLKEAGLTLDEITRVAHPGFNRDGLETLFLEPLGVDLDRGVWEYIRQVGHASVTEVLLGLEHLWTTGQVVPGDRVLLVSAGAGACAGCAVVEILTPCEPIVEG